MLSEAEKPVTSCHRIKIAESFMKEEAVNCQMQQSLKSITKI